MLLNVQKYDVTIVYKPGREMYLADTLSRAFLENADHTQGRFDRMNAVKSVPMTDESLEEIKRSTHDDEVLQQLKTVIQSGWPEDKHLLPIVLTLYYGYRDELRKKERIHSSHIGINGCLRRARECMFWPCMSADLKQYISQCETCGTYEIKQQKKTVMSHEFTERPWDKIGVDLYTIDSNDYLIVVDYFSNFWEIDHLTDTKASTAIKKLNCHFARQGIPEVVISDNGPQFACEQFPTFASDWGFEHRPGSPGHQQTNGKAEAAAKQAKSLLRKARKTKGDLHLALLALRNTPTESMGTSPAQRLLGRRCRTLLPTTKGLLKPKTVQAEVVQKETQARQVKQAKYYNQEAKDLPSLEKKKKCGTNETVQIRTKGKGESNSGEEI